MSNKKKLEAADRLADATAARRRCDPTRLRKIATTPEYAEALAAEGEALLAYNRFVREDKIPKPEPLNEKFGRMVPCITAAEKRAIIEQVARRNRRLQDAAYEWMMDLLKEEKEY